MASLSCAVSGELYSQTTARGRIFWICRSEKPPWIAVVKVYFKLYNLIPCRPFIILMLRRPACSCADSPATKTARPTLTTPFEGARTEAGPRQHVVAHLGELNHDEQRRWQRAVVIYNCQGNPQQQRRDNEHWPIERYGFLRPHKPRADFMAAVRDLNS